VTTRSITPRELAARLSRGERLVLLDVREPAELALCRIDGARSIPLGSLGARLGELPNDATIVCICHHGIRSAQAASFLRHAGFASVLNLAGGVERWALEVDPAFPRY
jgi:rhodanese-related sulfurtransferase